MMKISTEKTVHHSLIKVSLLSIYKQTRHVLIEDEQPTKKAKKAKSKKTKESKQLAGKKRTHKQREYVNNRFIDDAAEENNDDSFHSGEGNE